MGEPLAPEEGGGGIASQDRDPGGPLSEDGEGQQQPGHPFGLGEEQAAGRHRVGGRIEVIDVQGFDNSGGKYLAVVRVREHPSEVVDAHGNVVEQYDTVQEAKLQVGLIWADDSWAVDGVAVDTQGT